MTTYSASTPKAILGAGDPHCAETHRVALWLADMGIAVFPLVYCTKVPEARSRGFYDATTNPAVLERLFSGDYRRNLGARCGQVSGVFVLDVDQLEALEQLEAPHGRLPVTLMSASSRGHHYWFKTTPIPIPSSTAGSRPASM